MSLLVGIFFLTLAYNATKLKDYLGALLLTMVASVFILYHLIH